MWWYLIDMIFIVMLGSESDKSDNENANSITDNKEEN
jgi:hypothetical protein